MIQEEDDGVGSRDAEAQRFFALDDRIVDTLRNVILRDGEVVKVEPRVMDVLVYLVRARGRVISQQELMEQVWGVQVVDEAIQRAISLLRVALGEHRGRSPLETIPRKGYRLLAEPEDLKLRMGRRPHQRAIFLAIAFAAGVVLTLLFSTLVTRGPAFAPNAPPSFANNAQSVAPSAPE